MASPEDSLAQRIISPPDDHLSRRLPWSPSTSPANGNTSISPLQKLHSSNYPSTDSFAVFRSLSAISARAFILGAAFSFSLFSAIYLLLLPATNASFTITHTSPNPLWRLPFFLATLSLFHFLEYFVTAAYNPSAATVSAFLLQNGSAYNIAHMLAFVECLVMHTLLPASYYLLPPPLHKGLLALGLSMLVMGQTTRSLAMAQAGSNFNHTVQSRKQASHQLVTTGVYGWLRHPSYFGFWWWGLGTQLVLGNGVCLLAYAVVLWRFFYKRIKGESVSL